MGIRLAIAGATGLVGHKLLEIIAAEGHDVDHIGAFASADSAGKTVRSGSRELTVQSLADCDFSDYDAALFAIGDELSAEYVPRALAAGCAVVDKSNAFRLDPNVPLVVAGVNDDAVTAKSRLVANPNCSTIILLHALAPLERSFGVQRVFAATYQSVSGAGTGGVHKLESELQSSLLELPCDHNAAEMPFAYNVVPQIGRLDDLGRCSEEAKLVDESRKILGRPDLPVIAHAARVPVMVGHSIAVTVELERAVDADTIADAWKAHGVRVIADGVPAPLSAQTHDALEAGRLRTEPGVPNGWSFFVSGDNINIGAALNGWRILQLMIAAGAVQKSVAA